MKNSAVQSIILAVIFGMTMAAFAGPRAERARYEAKRQEKKEAFAAEAAYSKSDCWKWLLR